MQQEVVLAKTCFKIEKLNAKAMIVGFPKDRKIIHQAIYLKSRFKDYSQFPSLITVQKHNINTKRWGPSRIGKSLNYEDFFPHNKYVALLDDAYPVKDEKDLWEKVCHNGLFDVWEPQAPEEWKKDKKKYRNECVILLLRIYKIFDEFQEGDINHYDRQDTLKSQNFKVTLQNPVIDEEEFQQIKKQLKETTRPYLINIKH